jgi:hypothetical protein
MKDIELLPPLVDLQRRGIADLLARQQDEYDEYRGGKTRTENEAPPSFETRLRAARQAALKASSSTRNDLGPQYTYWPTTWVAVAVALSVLLFLKLRYG